MLSSKYPFKLSRVIQDKPFEVYWSKSADKAFKKRTSPLIVEMELKFACMVRMLVYFHERVDGVGLVHISDKLSVFYRPVMGQRYAVGEVSDLGKVKMGTLASGPMTERFPKRLKIDYKCGQWFGEYV
ncbi:MAG: hypothetical protein V3V09_06135 [Arenicellales bacterium]